MSNPADNGGLLDDPATSAAASQLEPVPPAGADPRAPRDHDPAARWESARHRLRPPDLHPGLAFLGRPAAADLASLLYRGYAGPASPCLWLSAAAMP